MTTKTDKKTKITLVVTPTGATKTVNRIFNNVNPVCTDDQALYFANKLGTLTSDTLGDVIRTDTAKLIAE